MNITILEKKIIKFKLIDGFLTLYYLVEYRLDKSFENLFDNYKWEEESLRSIEYTFFFSI